MFILNFESTSNASKTLRGGGGDTTCMKCGINFERHIIVPRKHWRFSLLVVDGMFFTARVFF